jgi:hypothetical protein
MTCCMTITKGGLFFMTRQMLLNSLAGVNPYYFFLFRNLHLLSLAKKFQIVNASPMGTNCLCKTKSSKRLIKGGKKLSLQAVPVVPKP